MENKKESPFMKLHVLHFSLLSKSRKSVKFTKPKCLIRNLNAFYM